MRRFLWIPLLLALVLAACSPGASDFHCDGGICITLEIEEPIKALEPSLATVTVRTAIDMPGLGVGLSSYHAGDIKGPLKSSAEGAKVTYQEDRSLSWRLDAKGGETYTFSAYVVFDEPPASYGVFSYLVNALATNSGKGTATDSVRIYLDAAGNQMDADKAREMEGPLRATVIFGAPEPTATQTPTPRPSPTMTPKPTAMPTLEPAVTPTVLRAYPEP